MQYWTPLVSMRLPAVSGLPSSRVLVYTGAWFWNPQAGGSSVAARHPLWVSGYTPGAPPMPKGWSSWTYWQYTDAASDCGPSSKVDCSVLHGSVEELHRMAGLS
eukprot:5142479-Prymnesium_polylepis.2